ncbi:MAG: archaellin/type IV pilin N-terminal domain-containing protein [Archaeoglobaceae archaeon]
MNSRGASEVVGSLLTVALIVTAAGLIYMISQPVISSSVDSVKFRNAVKSMAEIKELVERMKYGEEIATTKTIQLNGGSITSAAGGVSVFVPSLPRGLAVVVPGTPGAYSRGYPIAAQHAANYYELPLHNLEIEVSGREVVLESGIFIKEFGRVVPVPVSPPEVVATNDTLYITFFDFSGNLSAGGYKVTLNFRYAGTYFGNVTYVEIRSEFCQIWKESIADALRGTRAATITYDGCKDEKKIRVEGNVTLLLTVIEVS